MKPTWSREETLAVAAVLHGINVLMAALPGTTQLVDDRAEVTEARDRLLKAAGFEE